MKLFSSKNLLPPDGWRIQVVEQTDSTNDHLFRLALQGEAEGLVLIARSQSCGKGSRSRSFFSPEGGIYLSLLLRDIAPELFSRLTPIAAVALFEALRPHTDKALAIKWVNDIYLEGKKLCGILTETKFLGEARISVVGVGINLVAPEGGYPTDFLHPATALLPAPDPAVAEAIINTFLKRFTALIKEGVLPPLYKENCCTLGKAVTLRQGERNISATALDIAEDGALLLRLPDGSIQAFSSGEVTSQIKK